MKKRDCSSIPDNGADLETFYLQIKIATTSHVERELELMVYELCGLSEEEIGVVEGS
jgi:hypothetical protein